jgi:3-deoxy-D-manno-octulosonate 8-phosphate phosphatase (KDO 8-P phosphatase)
VPAGLKRQMLVMNKTSLICYDFDGVMTDNRALIFDDGREAVFVNRGDGLAIAAIRQAGTPQVIISTEANEVVLRRAEKLKVPVFHDVSDKAAVLNSIVEEFSATLQSTVFIGNDVNDLAAMKMVGYPVAPSDAHSSVLAVARLITEAPGGAGVVREFYDRYICGGEPPKTEMDWI